MKRDILLSLLCTLFVAITVNAAEPWQFSFSKETSTAFKNKGAYQQFVSPLCELEEPTDIIRLTVFATRNTDMNTGTRAEGFSNSAPAFPTFAISEIRVYDEYDNLVELAEENFDGYVSFVADSVGLTQSNLFALRVSGESMINAGIMDGDIVIVDRREYAENGEIVVAMIDDSATVKTFYREEGRYRLQPENPTMEPIYTQQVIILGKVVASMRLY